MNSAKATKQDDNPKDEEDSNETDYESLYLRAKADLENYRKQVERDKSEFAKFASENLITQLLPILNNFQRAKTHLPEGLQDDEWAKGIMGVEKQFEQVLESAGLQKIEINIGESCDTTLHEAIATGEGKSGEILEVIEAGYELNGKVLRAAKVKVGQ
jgi:molecular chaperone GrpE